MIEVRMTDEVDEAGVEELRNAVIAFNVAVTGYSDRTSLGCLVRDHTGQLIAGLDGFTWGGYAMIEWLWVHGDYRHEGLGTRLVQAAEHEAIRRGCGVVRVNTHTFQAPGFYSGLGYSQIGVAVDTPVGHGEVFLQKRLHTHNPSAIQRVPAVRTFRADVDVRHRRAAPSSSPWCWVVSTPS
jgi:GNAT superfamily N-acetyltransferase